MREIKFRIWLHRGWPDKEYEMAEVDYYFFEEWGYQTSGEVESAGHKLMQFTGLKDKNGKEIYDGDIVQTVVTSEWDCDVPRDEEAVIEWDGFQWWAKSIHTADWHEIYDYPWEIIGNIYENPELLK